MSMATPVKTIVYLLQHSYEVETEAGLLDETKIIGIFSSKEKAEKTIEECKNFSGFKNYPENFYIDQYELDKRNWKEGFITWEEAAEGK